MSPLRRPPERLAAFPRYELRSSQPLYRIHPRARGPWWFSHDGSGRFDLAPPRGTCYLAEEPLGSFVEVFRGTSVVSRAAVDARALSTLKTGEEVSLADCTKSGARRFGITAAIHSSEDYRRTREWGSAFDRAGFGGVRYLVSHDPAQRLVGIALFGPAGAQERRVARTADIGADVLDEAAARFGIVVARAGP